MGKICFTLHSSNYPDIFIGENIHAQVQIDINDDEYYHREFENKNMIAMLGDSEPEHIKLSYDANNKKYTGGDNIKFNVSGPHTFSIGTQNEPHTFPKLIKSSIRIEVQPNYVKYELKIQDQITELTKWIAILTVVLLYIGLVEMIRK